MSKIWGKCVRSIKAEGGENPRVFLSFDDGPVPGCTERVLDLLKKHDAKATFFVIAERARKHRELFARILDEGHAFGNHSLDHKTYKYFCTPTFMENWIREAQDILHDLAHGVEPIGFRAPVGLRTFHVHYALNRLKIPLIHWNRRFFDTTFGLSPWRAKRSAEKLQDGDIILLHDSHLGERSEGFLAGLDALLSSCKRKGMSFEPIPRINFE